MTPSSPLVPSSGCPRRATLVDFLVGRLSEAELESVAAHLNTCPDCASAVSELDREATPDSVHQRVRRALQTPQPPELPVALTPAGLPSTVLPTTPPGETPAAAVVEYTVEQRVGSAVGGYRLLEPLGSGGMGRVFRAEQLTLGRMVAVKLLHDGTLADEAERARFRREAAALARLQHAHAVRLVDYGEDGEQAYLVLELVEGGSLADRLAQGPLKARQAAALVRDVATAVEQAHQAGVLHRDLKPSNILLDTDGTAKVTDFGLAWLADASSLTTSGAVVGTAEYLAPEQAGGEPATAATDVYGLGAVLYACLTGRPPVQGSDLLDALAKARTGQVAPLTRGVPPGLAAICRQALARQPAERYATAQALADDLDRWLGGARPLAQPRRYRWAIGLAAVGLVVAATAAVAVVLPAKSAVPEPDVSVEEIERQYQGGPPQVLLGATGKPAQMRQVTGHPVAADAPLAEDGSFLVEAPSQTHLELLADPGHDAYRLTAQVRHLRSERLGAVGLYVARHAYPWRGEEISTLLHFRYNDVATVQDSPFQVPAVANKPIVNSATPLFLFLSHDRQPHYLISLTTVGEGCPFSPAGKRDADWRNLDVTVTPKGLIFRFDGVTRTASLSQLKARVTALIRISQDRRPNEMLFRQIQPAMPPRGGLGLYVASGKACFRNVRLIPLFVVD